MSKTCFVIMGFGIKNNIDLDYTYNNLIKPCIIKNNLIPFPLYNEDKYNAYRCDEISGSISIDYKFVTCLNGADIVIADISTMNVNAIYELGARHALKPRSTILLCAKNKRQDFNFFDLTYVPIIFYECHGMRLSKDDIKKATMQLDNFIDFSVNSSTDLPDNPIQRALIESNEYKRCTSPQRNVYKLYLKAKEELDANDFKNAQNSFEKLYQEDPTEENLLLYVLAKYKNAESSQSCKELIECLNLITGKINIDNSMSEYLFGRLAAICLRIYQLCGDTEYYYSSLEYYRRGAAFCKDNLYCPRNYCAMLIRVHDITEDKNVIKEYYYTAKHYAKLFLSMNFSAKHSGSYDDRIYYYYNVKDLRAIIDGEYIEYEKEILRLKKNQDISQRQRDTILNGLNRLKTDLDIINDIF